MQRSQSFRTVHAIERNAMHYEMLTHNLKLYRRTNVYTHKGDAMQVLPSLSQDIVYFDPPWGGRNYKKSSRLRLLFSGRSLADVVSTVLHRHAPRVLLKLPRNVDLRGVRKLVSTMKPKGSDGSSWRSGRSRGTTTTSTPITTTRSRTSFSTPSTNNTSVSTRGLGRMNTGTLRKIRRNQPHNSVASSSPSSFQIFTYKEHRVHNFLLVYMSTVPK